MKIPALVALILLLASHQAVAYDFPEGARLHAITLRACQGISAAEIAGRSSKMDAYNLRRSPSPGFNELLSEIQRTSASRAWNNYEYRSRGVDARWVLIQRPFQQALRDCYGMDERATAWFASLVVLADTRGKSLSAVGTVGSLLGITRLIRGAYSMSLYAGRALSLTTYSLVGWELTQAFVQSRQFKREVQQACQQAQLRCSSDPVEAGLQLTSWRAGQIEEQNRSAQARGEDQSAARFFENLILGEIRSLEERLSSAPEAERPQLEAQLFAKRATLRSVVTISLERLSRRLESASDDSRPPLQAEIERQRALLARDW